MAQKPRAPATKAADRAWAAEQQIDFSIGRSARRAGLLIAGIMLVWLLLQLIGAEYNWPIKYTLLVDMFAIVGFVWALVMVFKIWRSLPASRNFVGGGKENVRAQKKG